MPESPLDGLYQGGGEREFPRDSPKGITKSLSHCHRVSQAIIRDRDLMQRQFDLKLRNAIILAIIGWVPAIVAFFLALWR
jgi:hypothetical protein